MLKKNVSTSRKLASLKSDSARLLCTWLLPHLDVAGRFSGESAVVRGAVVPRLKHLTEEKVEQILCELDKIGLLRLYIVDGERYLELFRFKDFQNLRVDRESESKIPKPSDIKENKEHSGSPPGVLRESSRALRDRDRDKDRDKDKLKDRLGGEAFNEFWTRYPRKIGKQDALDAFCAALKADGKSEELERALTGYLDEIKENKTEERYIKYPATFLRKNRWRDYLDKPMPPRRKYVRLNEDGTLEEVEVDG